MIEANREITGDSIKRFRSVLSEWDRLSVSKHKADFDILNLIPSCLARLALLETIAYPNAHKIDFITHIMGEDSLSECKRLGKGVRAGALMEVDPKRDFMFKGYLQAVTEKKPVGLCAQYLSIDGLRRKCIKICLPVGLDSDPAGWVLLYTEFLEPNRIHSEDRVIFNCDHIREESEGLERIAEWYSAA